MKVVHSGAGVAESDKQLPSCPGHLGLLTSECTKQETLRHFYKCYKFALFLKRQLISHLMKRYDSHIYLLQQDRVMIMFSVSIILNWVLKNSIKIGPLQSFSRWFFLFDGNEVLSHPMLFRLPLIWIQSPQSRSGKPLSPPSPVSYMINERSLSSQF